MFNTEKIQYLVSGSLTDPEYHTPLFVPDEIGPWAVRYVFIKKSDLSQQYNSGSGSNIRSSSSHLNESWRAHNALMINQCHLGNVVWRLKIINRIDQTVDMIEVWRTINMATTLFSGDHDIEIEQATVLNPAVTPARTELELGGTGLSTGSGLTINDVDTPLVYTKQHHDNLITGLNLMGFEIRTMIKLISPKQAIDVYHQFVELNSPDITVNTGWNSDLNPVL